jgi:hypothetical protein
MSRRSNSPARISARVVERRLIQIAVSAAGITCA